MEEQPVQWLPATIADQLAKGSATVLEGIINPNGVPGQDEAIVDLVPHPQLAAALLQPVLFAESQVPGLVLEDVEEHGRLFDGSSGSSPAQDQVQAHDYDMTIPAEGVRQPVLILLVGLHIQRKIGAAQEPLDVGIGLVRVLFASPKPETQSRQVPGGRRQDLVHLGQVQLAPGVLPEAQD